MPLHLKKTEGIDLQDLGHGRLAYMRRMRTEELAYCFPSLPPMTAGVELWALFGASGEPIILSDIQQEVILTAHEHDLETVAVH